MAGRTREKDKDGTKGPSVRALALRILMRTERGLAAAARGGPRGEPDPTDEAPTAEDGPAARLRAALQARPQPARRQVHEAATERRLTPRDAALLAELVYGSIRHRLTLDAIVRAHLRSTRKGRLEDAVRVALRLGTYQLVYTDRIPAHAAVSETVAALDRPGRRGFVNAVLRAVAASRRGVHEGGARPKGKPFEKLVPVHGGRWLELKKRVFPSVARGPARALAACHSHPEELVARWLEAFEEDGTEALLIANNEPPPLFARVNRLRIARDELLPRLDAEGVTARALETDEGIVIGGAGSLERLITFRKGLFTVQDATAQEVARRVDPQRGERILDLCAAPGGKTTHLAELSGDAATIVAVDVHRTRLALLERAVERLGLRSIRPVLAEPLALEDAPPPAAGEVDDDDADDAIPPEAPEAALAEAGANGSDDDTPERDGAAPASEADPVALATIGEDFDRVLVDVPCSNTGVLRRRVEARWRQPDADGLARLVALQQRLLAFGADRVRPGGLLVYSTCSIEEAENAEVVAAVIAARDDLELEDELASQPTIGGGDGGYVARIRRRG